MATPHVAGVAALYLAKNPSATPAQVKTALVTAGIQGKITDVGLGSPNILLNVHFASSVAPVPTPTPTPASPVGGNLINNEPVGNLADTAGGEKRFTLIVPANSASLTISLSGGGGDADLYVKNGAQPTLTVYKCRPYLIGNNETCNFTNPVAGSWFILLKSYSSYFGATLKAVINSK
jgi:serine protease